MQCIVTRLVRHNQWVHFHGFFQKIWIFLRKIWQKSVELHRNLDFFNKIVIGFLILPGFFEKLDGFLKISGGNAESDKQW